MPDKKVVMDMITEHAEQSGTTRDKLLRSKGWTQAKHLPKIWDFLMAMQGKHAHWKHHADMLKDQTLARKLQTEEKEAWKKKLLWGERETQKHLDAIGCSDMPWHKGKHKGAGKGKAGS